MNISMGILLMLLPAVSLAKEKQLPLVVGIKEVKCKFDLSTHDNKTVFNSLLFPLKAEIAVKEAQGLEGLLGPFKVQVLYHGGKYGTGKSAGIFLDKLTLTIWEPPSPNPIGITGMGESDVPLDRETLIRTRHMVKLTNEKKIVYYCMP